MTAKLLELRGLTKKFGGISAVSGLSFFVETGESLGLIGPNGSGKTTTFNLIMNELKPDVGNIFYKGRDIGKFPTHERVKMGISRTYQIPRPFNEMSVAHNIRIGLMPDEVWGVIRSADSRAREKQIGRSVGFGAQHLKALPAELSMGDLRRLELARTLATNPRLLLLDEVFAGLTTAEIAEISQLLKEKKSEGLTYIIVSHDLKSLAPLVDRVVVVSFGHLIAEGAFEAVVADSKVKEAYLGT